MGTLIGGIYACGELEGDRIIDFLAAWRIIQINLQS
jgi:hypothetical protein